jgi:hypothetical protein
MTNNPGTGVDAGTCVEEIPHSGSCNVECADGFEVDTGNGLMECTENGLIYAMGELTCKEPPPTTGVGIFIRIVLPAADSTWVSALTSTGGTTEDPCSSEDIECDGDEITDITFINRGLAGSIPVDELAQMTSLVKITLSGNAFDSEPPTSIGNLDLNMNQYNKKNRIIYA